MSWLLFIIGALVVLFLLLPLTTWVFYLAVMHVDKLDHQKLATREAYAIARWVIYPVGGFCNALSAWTWAPLLFWSWPREFATTKFLNRMVAVGGWRAERALLIRRHLLNNYDRRGEHT